MTARANHSDFMAPDATNVIFQRSMGVGLLFGVASLIGAILPGTREQFFHSYVLGYMLWLGITLGSMAILMIQHMTGGKWGMVIRRQLEAAVKCLPLLLVLFVPIIVGMPHLYDAWLHPDPKNEHMVYLSRVYMTPTFFIVRAIIYFAIWIIIGFLLTRLSAQQDNPPVVNPAPRFRRISAPGLILYAFTITFAVIDWVMSLSPPWISTIYGFIFIAGELLSAICVMVVVERILSNYEPMASLLKPKEVHDHGKLMLTFVMLFAYFSFSQLLIIWAGNLPTEINFYTRRLNAGWQAIGLALVIFHFAVPFLMLLSRPLKRSARHLVWIASGLIFMRYVDLYWYIEPNFHKEIFFSLWDLIVPIAIGGLWFAMFFRNLRQRPLLPVYDLHGQEFLEYVGAAHD